MKRFFLLLLTPLLLTLAPAQQSKPTAQPPADVEARELQTELSATSNTPYEIVRTLEKHLAKYPNSAQREEIERTIVRSAMESNDKARIIRYGERMLAENINQPVILERVAQALLESDGKEEATRALKYAAKFLDILRALQKDGTTPERNRGQLLEELDRAVSRALTMQARALGNTGEMDQAIATAKQAVDEYATAAAWRELARWQAKAGHAADAAASYAAAFASTDPGSKTAETDRAADRAAMSELYRKAHNGSEAGLGDLALQSWDRAAAFSAKRAAIQKERDPNSAAKDAMDFTLSAVEGEPVKLSSLKGKVLVLDFWATWCGPCRVQHPLYEEVRKKFRDRDDVVLLNISTDEDRERVKPFLDENKWSRRVFFEDGLGTFLRVSQIPTTIIIDRRGQIVTRLAGFVPERFVDQLTERIEDALKSN